MTYRERREAKAERLDEWAAKRAAKAEAGHARAQELGSVIPFGQPILAGHHSEGRDRRYRDRVAGTMDRAFQDGAKAQDMARRADGIRGQLDRSIYSDDPGAVAALQERIAVLEAERDRVKAYNLSCRRGTPDRSLLTEADARDLDTVARVAPYQLGKGGAFPGYKLSNLSGNIKRNRDRLAELQGRA